MAALVETMMYVREKPWHGQGVRVEEALTSAKAIEKAGLDWTVDPCPVFDQRRIPAAPMIPYWELSGRGIASCRTRKPLTSRIL